MSKIICSLEDWDTILNYYRPNGSSKTWYIKELKQLRIPLMWGDWNVLTENGEMFGDGHLRSQITPNHSNLIEYTTKENIKGSKHIYIINVYTNQFFITNKTIGFNCISKEYLDDIKNGNAIILMFFIYEGYSGIENNQDFEVIEQWRIDSNLPEYSVYYVCGNLLSEQIVRQRNLKINAKGIHYFEPWNKYNGDIVTFKPHEKKYLFLSYNRMFRYHRVRFVIDLIENNLIERGLISLNRIEHDLPYETTDEIKNFFKNVAPLTIDSLPELKYNLAINITFEDYEKTFISVVTETMVDNGTLFFSEKIWKPIMVGHPFMVYGNQGSLSYLKKLGFKTYDKWIDESYDDEPDRDKRCEKIVKELKKFGSMTLDELVRIRDEMREICEYNFIHYKNYFRDKYGNNDQSKEIRDILIEIWSNLSNDEIQRDFI